MTVTAPSGDILTRDQIAIEDMWDLSDMFTSDADWDAAAARLEGQIQVAASHRGFVGDSPMALSKALDDLLSARLTLERLRVYASLRHDENQTDDAAQARYERSTRLAIRAGEAFSWFEPELLALPDERLEALVEDPILRRYRHLLADLRRRRPHVRSAEIEELLAQSGDVGRAAYEAFGALDNADLTFGSVIDEDGSEVQLTKGRLALMMERKDRSVRKAASETFIKSYQDHQHTLASLYGSSVRTDVFYARVHNHESARAAALFDDNIPETVYDSLITAVRDAQPILARGLELRRRVLDVDQLATYDLRVPLAPTTPKSYPYREAVDLVLDGLGALGPNYVSDLSAGFDSRWVDVHESRGKRSGAYSHGAYGCHPVILMNWNGTLSDVFTLAHEAGHAMHSYYADRAQAYHDAGYPIFLAEIASTVNETLLTWDLLSKLPEDDVLGRFELLNRMADDISGTLINQTMYAEFEHRAHTLAEAGEPLTLDTLNNVWEDVSTVYLPGVAVDNQSRIRWARIPHFYRAFYVYKYATGISAAIAFATRIRDEGEPAREQYLQLLRDGGSDYPLELVRKAGLDMTSPEPVRAALAEYDRVIGEMEQLIDSGRLTA
ncbi:MAG TPA: oligoendopeptidase F [Thermomicrobiales bacterium]|jgi:oligoendopeptidase F|nr:oligoendopeptidase F [Thermomicrobiales bacterium]